MSRTLFSVISFLAVLACLSNANAQQAAAPRLSRDILDVMPPSDRVRGAADHMTMRPLACRSIPASRTRRRIVDIAVQEWGFFGFSIVDQSDFGDEMPPRQLWAQSGIGIVAPAAFGPARRGGRFPPIPAEEAMRVAHSVGGYWAATSLGGAMIANQNKEWNGPEGVNGRWADPWSAAFISWVMCEAGLGDTMQFQRAIAHWTYIDQAIGARDGRNPAAAFAAYDLGEEKILPGDLLCSGRRPAYRSIAQRRGQLGIGARSHCDVVVDVDEEGGRILTVGGNVRRTISLKIFAAVKDANGNLRPADPPEGAGMRPLFAHLKLRADPIEPDALGNSPTMKALGCDLKIEERHPAYNLYPAGLATGAC
jgi:hypothetical protein